MFGSSLVLNKQEGLISDILIKAKRAEIEDSRVNGTIFPPAINFFESKKLIDSSKVFQIIKRMPKGRYALYSWCTVTKCVLSSLYHFNNESLNQKKKKKSQT